MLNNMNLIEALRAGKYVRRPIAKHTGSTRTGWLCRDYVKDLLTSMDGWRVSPRHGQALINSVDLMADDWEANNSSS